MEKHKILIVDDSEFNRKILVNLLEDEYDTIEAENGVEALDAIRNNLTSLSLVLMDILMPEMSGLDVLKVLNEKGLCASLPVILITASDSSEEYGLNLGAVDFIAKPFNPSVVKMRVRNHINLKNTRDMLEDLIAFDASENERYISDETAEILANLAEFRSFDHIKTFGRVKKITKILTDKLIEDDLFKDELTEETASLIIAAMPFCDLGKLFIPEHILFKKGKLTDDEFEIVKKHTYSGSKIISRCFKHSPEKFLLFCEEICLNHHENWDGTGYPNGISKNAIPLSARIASVCDVYDALLSHRVYRDAYSFSEATNIIMDYAGKQFDPKIIKAFMSCIDDIESVYKK